MNELPPRPDVEKIRAEQCKRCTARGAIVGTIFASVLMVFFLIVAGGKLGPDYLALALSSSMFLGLGAGIGALLGRWQGLEEARQIVADAGSPPTRQQVIVREIGIGVRRGFICGVVYGGLAAPMMLYENRFQDPYLWFRLPVGILLSGMIFAGLIGVVGFLVGCHKARKLH